MLVRNQAIILAETSNQRHQSEAVAHSTTLKQLVIIKNYVTEVESQNSKGVKWGVKANSFVTPNGQVSAYDQYLFAQDPTGPAARDYFVPDNQLPPLIQSGFNPSFITTLSHEKGKGDKSEFEITYGRNMDATYAYVTRHRLAVDRKHDAFKTETLQLNMK